MKIGFSYGRCVRDLVAGVVEYDDVLLVYASTCIRERDQVPEVMRQYGWQSDYLRGLDEAKCAEVALRLWDDGKIIQPRVDGKSVRRIRESGVWMDLAPTMTGDAASSPLVQKAWKDYQMALKLSSPEIMPDDQFRKPTEAEQRELDEALDLLAGSI